MAIKFNSVDEYIASFPPAPQTVQGDLVEGRCWQGYFFDTEGNTFGIFEVDGKAGLQETP